MLKRLRILYTRIRWRGFVPVDVKAAREKKGFQEKYERRYAYYYKLHPVSYEVEEAIKHIKQQYPVHEPVRNCWTYDIWDTRRRRYLWFFGRQTALGDCMIAAMFEAGFEVLDYFPHEQ